MKLLITGAEGQLGRCLQDVISEKSNISVIALNRQQLDISDLDAAKQSIVKHTPDIVINAAAYTAVDKAESEWKTAYSVNADGPENLACACQTQDIPLIHVSTDYVFDGTATSPYQEDAKTNPLGVYGASKLAGEEAVANFNPKHIIVRAAWVFSEYGNNFLKTMLQLGADRSELSIVYDQHGSPTYAGDLARALIRIAEHAYAAAKQENWGTYHFCGGGQATWLDFAKAIFEQAQKTSVLSSSPVLAGIPSTQYPTPAKRPAYSVLDGAKLKQNFAIEEGNWCAGIAKSLQRLSKL